MTSSLEKAARAVCAVPLLGHDSEEAWSLAIARAVLLAVREADESIVDRGTAQINYDCPVPLDALPDADYSQDVRQSFTAMIDAILEDKP